jgi:hypothetical protein
MSTTATPVEVGQIRQDPRDDSFVLVMRRETYFGLGYMTRPVDRFGQPTGRIDRHLLEQTLTTWALMPADTITEPQ